ncbi:MAG: pyridoxal phosphate-dependent aminotransferase [Actinobacteria bacterium]|nr:pyridoxal phosphate-dependent aminotransferase [Actinomycetota bacterium]
MTHSRLSDRVTRIEPSATLAVSQKAKAMRAAGEDVIGFGAGEPDFPTAPHIVEAARRAAADPRMHGYTPAAGLPELREAVADKTRRDSGYDVTSSQVLITNGGKQALYEVFQALIDPGDEVLVPAPYWVSYPEQIRLAGGQPVVVSTSVEDDFTTSVEQLDRALTDRTKALLFVSPSNPTGTVYEPQVVEAIGRWAADNGLWVVTDEIYEHLVYGDAEFSSMPVLVPDLQDRCVVVNGVAKTYAMTGWRVGWAMGPADLIGAATRVQSHLSSNVSNVAQAAAIEALTGPQDVVATMREAFDRRRKFAVDRLRAIPGVVCPEPRGAFYAFPDVSSVLGRTIGGVRVETTLALAAALLDAVKVALVPGEGFGAPGCVRISYAISDEALEEGLDRLAAALTA